MPELPELEILRRELEAAIRGKIVQSLTILKPYVLKTYFAGDIAGEYVREVLRRGKYIIIGLARHSLTIHLALRGSLTYLQKLQKIKKTYAALVRFQDGSILLLSEQGHKKMMSLHITARGDSPAKLKELGIEPLGSGFTVERLGQLLKEESRRIKPFLRDQRKISGIGNAYADDILWQACISPFKITTTLTAGEVRNLHCAITETLENAITEMKSTRLSERRNVLKIHGQKNAPCPRCGMALCTISSVDSETFYCPTCQTKGRRLKDRRMSRFYR